jgi:hypothetical protein
MYKIQDTAFLSHLIPTAKLIISKLCHYTHTTEGGTMEWNLPHSPPVILSQKWWLWKSCVIKCFGSTDRARQCWSTKQGRSNECHHSQHPWDFLLWSQYNISNNHIAWFLQILLDVTWCILTGYHCFGKIYCLYLPHFFQMLASIFHTTHHHILEDINLYIQQCENLKSHIKILSEIFFYIMNTRWDHKNWFL